MDTRQSGDKETVSSSRGRGSRRKLNLSSDSKSTKRFGKQERAILEEWMNEHSDFPYPDPRQENELVELTRLSRKQIKTWMTNHRRRKMNLKRGDDDEHCTMLVEEESKKEIFSRLPQGELGFQMKPNPPPQPHEFLTTFGPANPAETEMPMEQQTIAPGNLQIEHPAEGQSCENYNPSTTELMDTLGFLFTPNSSNGNREKTSSTAHQPLPPG